MYGSYGAVTIRDNTDNIVYLGGNDLDTADQIARRINKPVDEVRRSEKTYRMLSSVYPPAACSITMKKHRSEILTGA